MLDQHAKRSTPIADVILFGDPVSNKGEHAHNGIADNRGAEMPNVHLFGHVGMRVVDNDVLGKWRGTHTKVAVVGRCRKLRCQELITKREVQKAGASNLDVTAHADQEVSGDGQHGFGNLTRILAKLLGDGQRTVGLRVGAVAGSHYWIYAGAANGSKGRSQQFGDGDNRISHGLPFCPFSHVNASCIRNAQPKPTAAALRQTRASTANVGRRLSSPRSSGDRALVSGTMCGSSNLSEGALHRQ